MFLMDLFLQGLYFAARRSTGVGDVVGRVVQNCRPLFRLCLAKQCLLLFLLSVFRRRDF